MLAFSDESLARLVRRARDVPWRQRRAWLHELADKLDPPIDQERSTETTVPRSPAARRQARVRARRMNGVHVYQLELADLAVEGLIEMMVATGQLTETQALDHQRIEAELARLLEEQGERWTG